MLSLPVMTAGTELARLMNARFAGCGGGAAGGEGVGGDRELLRVKVASLEGEVGIPSLLFDVLELSFQFVGKVFVLRSW